jgi:DNA repair exonuclease SbcCD nuclease subunit
VNKRPFIPNVAARNLALLGDIGQPTQPMYQAFICLVAKLYQTVIIIFGNHEYHGHRGDYNALDNWFERWLHENKLANVHFLQNRAIELEGVKILGSTLWSSISEEQFSRVYRTMRDYRVTDATPATTNALHRQAVSWIETELSEPCSLPCVVLTHHVPIDGAESAGPYFGNAINSAFCTDLSHLMVSPVVAWCYGHVHYNNKFKVGPVYLYSNHVGYATENLAYDPACVVRIKED